MPSRIRNITVDCADPYLLASFWGQVTGFTEDPDDPNVEGGDEAFLANADGPGLLFLRVPEGKAVKNRVHVDLVPSDRGRDAEVQRLVALGASQLADHREDDGTGWVVLADPEGNEFCVERSDAERQG